MSNCFKRKCAIGLKIPHQIHTSNTIINKFSSLPIIILIIYKNICSTEKAYPSCYSYSFNYSSTKTYVIMLAINIRQCPSTIEKSSQISPHHIMVVKIKQMPIWITCWEDAWIVMMPWFSLSPTAMVLLKQNKKRSKFVVWCNIWLFYYAYSHYEDLLDGAY